MLLENYNEVISIASKLASLDTCNFCWFFLIFRCVIFLVVSPSLKSLILIKSLILVERRYEARWRNLVDRKSRL